MKFSLSHNSRHIIPSIVSAVVLILLILSFKNLINNNLNGRDGIEFAISGKTLSIAHPPGYPLFIIIINFLTNCFPQIKPILLVKIISFTALILSFFAFKNYLQNKIISLPFFLLFSFSQPVIVNTITGEVYNLEIFFLILFLILFQKNIENRRYLKLIILISFTSLTLRYIYTPVTLFIIACLLRKKLITIRDILIFSSILAIYLYIPLRSINKPYINWGNPSNLKNFINHLTGKQYKFFVMKGGIKESILRLKWIFIKIKENINPSILPLAILGLYYSYKKNLYLLTLELLILINYTLYGLIYHAEDWMYMITPIFLIIALWISKGVYFIYRKDFKLGLILLLLSIFFQIPIYTKNFNFAERIAQKDISKFFSKISQKYPNAIVLTDNDAITFAYWYLNYYTDLKIKLINIPLLKTSWYNPYKIKIDDIFRFAKKNNIQILTTNPTLKIFEGKQIVVKDLFINQLIYVIIF